MNFFSVVDADRSFTSIYNGYMGIAPYSESSPKRFRSFLYQLKESGMIENVMVSFFVKPGRGTQSSIKFGSWDPNAIASGFRMYKTTSPHSWAVDAVQFKLGDTDLGLGHRYIELNPMYPYLYLPDEDFKAFAAQIHTNYESWYQNDICDEGKCKWDKPCKEVEGW